MQDTSAGTQADLMPLGLGDGSIRQADLSAFVSRRDESVGRSGPHGHHLAVLLLEVEQVVGAVDTHDIQSRDRVRKAAAAAVCNATRTEDFPARIGPDHFALAVTYWEPADLFRVARRIKLAFEQSCRSCGVACTMSIGIAGSRQWPRHRLAELAGKALESTRARGGNTVEMYTESVSSARAS